MQRPPSLTSIVWGNIGRLMGQDDPSIDAVKARTAVGRGTIQRIKAGENVEVSSIAQLAKDFRVDAWQLLAPPAPTGSPSVVSVVRADEAAPAYAVQSNENLLSGLAELLTRVPSHMQGAFADVLAGWARDGGRPSRQAALMALLDSSPSKQPRRA